VQDIVVDARAIVFLGCGLVGTPVAVNDKLQPQRVSGTELRAWASTYLVLVLGLGKLDGLLEDAVLLLQLHRLVPAVEVAGHKDLVGRVFPGRRVSWVLVWHARRKCTYHVKV